MPSPAIDYSLIIPAFNEAAALPVTLAAADAARQGVPGLQGEVVVVDNNSSDATAQVARGHGVRVVFEGHNQISRARNAGAAAARGRFLVFIDADTQIDAGLLRGALDALASGQVVGGGARLVFDRPTAWPARLALWLWNTYSRITGEAAGCFLYCRADAFEAVGGFSEKLYASEEIWLSKAIRRHGRVQGRSMRIIADPPAVTSARKAENPIRSAGAMALMLLFPPAVFFRGLCGFWYRRVSPAEAPAAAASLDSEVAGS